MALELQIYGSVTALHLGLAETALVDPQDVPAWETAPGLRGGGWLPLKLGF